MQTSKRDQYRELLVGEGYRPFIDEDGDLAFRVDGYYFVLFPHESDALYFQLAMPNIWRFQSIDTVRVLKLANKLSRDLKVAKVICLDNCSVWIAIELLFPMPEDARAILHRAVEALVLVRRRFIDEIRQPPEPLAYRHLGTH